MNFIKDFFKDLNKDELIFDAIIVISSMIIQKLIFSGTIDPKKIPNFVFFIFSFIFIVSLSYMMGTYFAKYNENYNKSQKIRYLPNYMAWLIFPGIFIIGIISILKINLSDNTRNVILLVISTIIIVSAIIGSKIEKGYSNYKEKIKKPIMYFSSLTLSIIETVIIMSKQMSKHPEKDAVAIILGLIFIGYVPYRLVISFAPPVNKRNLFFAIIAVLITVGNLSFF